MKILIFLVLTFLSCTSICISQKSDTDLLWQKFNDSKVADSIRFSAINSLIWDGYLYTNPDSALALAKIQYTFAKEIKNEKQMASALNSQSVAYKILGNQLESITKINEALVINRKIGNTRGEASCYLNLGNNYLDSREFDLAIKMYLQSLEMQVKLNNKPAQALCLNNLGLTYFNMNKLEDAKKTYLKSLQTYRESSDSTRIFYPLNNLGSLYLKLGDFARAERYYKETIRICELQNNDLDLAIALSGLSDTYRALKKYDLSISTGKISLAKLQSLHALYDVLQNAKGLYESYLAKGMYKEALEMQSLVNETNGKLNEEEAKKELLRQEYQFAYAKQHFKDSIRALEEKKLNDQKYENQIGRQRMIIWFGLGFLALALFIVYGLVRLGKEREKARVVLEEKNQLIIDNNKSVTDSIVYANYLQKAILPSISKIASGFKDSFVFFQAKDVVSGDFYWYHDYGAARVLAVADCTGHGVPGAFMSMMGYEVLNNVMSDPNVQSPALALSALDERIRINLNQDESRNLRHDGMDITVLVYQPKINRVQLAGAGNNIIQIRNQKLITHQLDKHGVGGIHEKKKTYKMIEFDVEPGDCFYLFTDGYQDQFGGPKGKKLMRKQMFDLFLKNHDLPFDQQAEILNERLQVWRGDLEQVDDICIIGLRL